MRAKSEAAALYAHIRDYVPNNTSASTLLLVLLAYGLLTIVSTYPVAFNIPVAPAGIERGDRFEYVWTLWWTKKAFIDLQASPASLTMLYYPHGAYHPLLLLDACFILSSLPLVLLFGPVMAYNLYFLGSYVLTGFTTYLLCYSVTGRRWPSFLGGVVFAFIPFRSLHGAHGHLEILTTSWLPLYILFLFRLMAKPGVRNAVLCGVLLTFSLLSTPLIAGHAVIPVTLLFFSYQYVQKRRHLFDARILKGLATACGIALVLIIPFYYPMLGAMIQGRSLYIARTSALGYSADLLSFVVPWQYQFIVSKIQPLQEVVLRLIPRHLEIENVVYMGLIPLLLASVGVWKMRSRVVFWVVLAVVTGMLALGPLLRIGGRPVEYSYKDVSSYVVLPGAILTKLPLYEWMRGPARFSVTTALSLAVLASCGLSALTKSGMRSMTKLGLTSVLVVTIMLEYAAYFPFPVAEAPVPDLYYTLAQDSQDYGVLDVSELPYNHRGMYYQTVHQHGIVRGHMHRIPLEASGLIHFFEQSVNPRGEILSYDFVQVLNQLRIGYVVLHKDWKTDVQLHRPFLAQHLGESVYEDEDIVAFAVPSYDAETASRTPLLVLGDHWHPSEYSGGAPFRWMTNDATIYARVEDGGRYQLHFEVSPFNAPRHLQVFLGGNLIVEYHVGGMQTYTTPAFTLAGGEWVPITLHVPEGCERPDEVMEGSVDARCLSMLFREIGILAP
jgi:hypothetical protein